MKRHYYLHDAQGKRKLDESELPLRIGGTGAANIVLPGLDENRVVAYIALEKGHAFLQPFAEQAGDETVDTFLNDEQITRSCWLKSGDRIQINEHTLSWTVRGDKIVIELLEHPDQRALHPPMEPPPESPAALNNELPVSSSAVPVSNRGGTLRKLFLGLLSLLLLLAIYLMMLIPLTLETEPAADTLELNGFPPPVKLWGSHLVMPGSYRLKAMREGYAPLDREINVDRSSDTSLHFPLEELPGRLLIAIDPQVSYTVYADDQLAPLNEQGQALIAGGSRNIRVEAERFLTYRETVEMKGYGKPQELAVTLQPAWADLTISSYPDSAEVYLDGQLIGRTPLQTEIMQGKRSFEYRLEGYKPLTRVHEITAGEPVTLEPVQLEPLDGELVVNSDPPGASVSFNGNYRGTTPLTLVAAAGKEHELQLSKAGFKSMHRHLLVQPEEVRELKLKLAAEYGTLFISIKPADAEVRVDGKPVQIKGGRLRLSVLPHRLSVEKAGYQGHAQTVTPRKDVAQHIEVVLKPAQEAAPDAEDKSALPPRISSPGGESLQLIQASSILVMGASRREAGRRANENRRLVELKRPFYFAHRETTNREYRQFKADHDSGSLDGANLNDDGQPVVNVSWDEAARYCNWLSVREGLPEAYREIDGKMLAAQPMNTGYRLPSEAEWAWVARRHEQESEQRYPWGDRYPPEQSAGNYADARIADTLADVVPAYDDGYRGTAPVGQFPDRPRGFFDLGGNAAEWVHDYYTLYPGQGNLQVTDPLGPATGTHHSVRGSGWRHGNITELRLSFRDYSNKARPDLGFRIAR